MTGAKPTSTMFHGAGRTSATRPFRSDIQGLRGIAVLFVVLYHAGMPGFSGGFVGVDVFFVISGFLITPILYDEVRRRGRIDVPAFLARRVRRLLPAMAAMLVVTGLAGLLIYSPFEHTGFANTLLSSALYASNLWFTHQRTDYLAGNVAESPLLHTWSLSVEEQFYLLWPFVVLAAAWIGRRTRIGLARAVLLAIGAAGVVSFALSAWLTDAFQPFAFFMMPTRVWEFAAGGAAALLVARHSAFGGTRAASAAALAALVVLAATCVLLDETLPFPGFVAIVPVAATALLLAAGSDGIAGPAERLLGWPALQYVGTVSYSFYLWHWPLLVYAEELGLAESLAARIAWVGASFGLAVLSYHFVENPLRRSRSFGLRPARALVVLAGFSLVAGGTALAWRGAADRWQEAPGQRVLVARGVTATSLRDADCIADFDAVEPVACRFGEEGAATTLVLLGDSHAAQWFPPLRRMAEDRGWRLVTFVKSACPALDASFHYYAVGRRYRECEEWRSHALDALAAMEPDLVIVTSSLDYDVEPARWREGTRALFDRLENSSGAVLHLRDNPRPGFDVPACLSRADWRRDWGGVLALPAEDCRFDRPTGVHRARFGAERAEIARREAVHGLDLHPHICPGNICPVVAGGAPIYRDTNHLTEDFARSLAPVLETRILELLAPVSPPERIAAPPSEAARASL
jgi:peptidoglycan/LPS O-acetylase OafA/YrhL